MLSKSTLGQFFAPSLTSACLNPMLHLSVGSLVILDFRWLSDYLKPFDCENARPLSSSVECTQASQLSASDSEDGFYHIEVPTQYPPYSSDSI